MKINNKKRWWTLFLTLSTFNISTITLLTLSSCAAAQDAAQEKIKILRKQDAEELGLYNKKIINQEDLKDFDKIDEYVFYNNQNLEAVHFPSNIKEIGDGAFQNCKNLKRISFAKDSELKRIGDRAFFDTMILDPFLPDSVTFIGRKAFKSPRIKIFRYPNNMDVIDLNEVDFNWGKFEREVDTEKHYLRLPKNLKKIAYKEDIESRFSNTIYPFGWKFAGFLPIEDALNDNELLPQTLEEISTSPAFGDGLFEYYNESGLNIFDESGKELKIIPNTSLYIPGSVRTVNENFLDSCIFEDVYLPPHLYNAKDANNKNKRYKAPNQVNIKMWDGKNYPDEDKIVNPSSNRS